MGKRSKSRRNNYRRRTRATARQIRYLTRGMDNPNFEAIARKLGMGKDSEAVRRAARKSQTS